MFRKLRLKEKKGISNKKDVYSCVLGVFKIRSAKGEILLANIVTVIRSWPSDCLKAEMIPQLGSSPTVNQDLSTMLP